MLFQIDIVVRACTRAPIKATHGVITNARADHLDVMGPTEDDVAWALAATIPVRAKLFTAESRHLSIFRHAAEDRETQLVQVGPEQAAAITDAEMENFTYVEHKENVALALSVCRDLGIEREIALRGMWKAAPDPGALTISHVRFFGRHIYFVNAFAANDPESTEQLWNMAIERFPDVERRIAIFNCRADRPTRSQQLGEVCTRWKPADYYLLIGSGTYFFLKAAMSNGMEAARPLPAEHQEDDDLFEMIVELAGSSALVVGMGNIKGQGLTLVRVFHNRSILKDALKKEAA